MVAVVRNKLLPATKNPINRIAMCSLLWLVGHRATPARHVGLHGTQFIGFSGISAGFQSERQTCAINCSLLQKIR
jgi:hypothetical protein